MEIKVSRVELDARREHIESLVKGNSLTEAKNGLLDFAREVAPAYRKDAIIIAHRATRLLNDERVYGPTKDSDAERNRLVDAILETAGIIHQEAITVGSRNSHAAERIQVVPDAENPSSASSPSTNNDSAIKRLPLQEARALFNQERQKRTETLNPADSVYVAREVAKGYRRSKGFQLQGVSLELKRGEITGIIGLNGSGKTTLLKIIAGELKPEEGHYAYPLLQPGATGPQDVDWLQVRRQIAYVPQSPPAWVGRLDDNLHYAAALYGAAPEDNRNSVDFYLARLGIEEFRTRTWNQLSGGYQTRFELACALVKEPGLLILDEPLAALDIVSRDGFLADLRELANSIRRPLPIVVSSQNLYELEAIVDRIVFLKEGRPIFSGPVGEIGKNRTENTFELHCDRPLVQIRVWLAELGARCEEGPISSHLVRTPLNVSSQDVLKELLKRDVVIHHFRNISQSVRILFEKNPSESEGT